MADLVDWAYGVGLVLVAATFYDAPWRLARALRHGDVIDDRAYHVANLLSVVIILAWPTAIVLGYDRPWLARLGIPGSVRLPALAVAWAGFLFALWARAAMGRFFAPTAVVQKDHEVVDRGPFAWVRHPFYAGLWLALAAGTVVLDSVVTGLIAVLMLPLIIVIGHREEAHLVDHLGGAYKQYRRRVPAFVPRGRRAR